MPAFRARSVSEDTVRIHPSPAPRAAGPSHLDSTVLREDDPATLMSQLMASQQALHASDRESGSMPPAPQQSMPAAGLMANLSEPGVLAFPLQKGAPFSPYCCGLQCNVSVVVKSVFPDLQQPEQQNSKPIHAWDIIQQCCICCAGDSTPSTMDSSMNLGTQAGHSRSTTSAMTVSDQSTTTGFSDSLPVMHLRDMSDVSALSGLPSGEMPGPSGAYCLLFLSSLSQISVPVICWLTD